MKNRTNDFQVKLALSTFCDDIDFHDPKLGPWKSKIYKLITEHRHPLIVVPALIEFFRLLRDNRMLSMTNIQIDGVLLAINSHREPLGFWVVCKALLMQKLDLDSDVSKLAIEQFETQPEGIKWLAKNGLLTEENIDQIVACASLWFDDQQLNEYYAKESAQPFTQEGFNYFVSVSKQYSAGKCSEKMARFYLASYLCQRSKPTKDLQQALMHLQKFFATNHKLFEILGKTELILNIPETLYQAEYPSNVVKQITSFLSDPSFLGTSNNEIEAKDNEIEANLRLFITYARLWFDDPSLNHLISSYRQVFKDCFNPLVERSKSSKSTLMELRQKLLNYLKREALRSPAEDYLIESVEHVQNEPSECSIESVEHVQNESSECSTESVKHVQNEPSSCSTESMEHNQNVLNVLTNVDKKTNEDALIRALHKFFKVPEINRLPAAIPIANSIQKINNFGNSK